MDQNKKTKIWVIAIIAVCAILVIGTVWSFYFSAFFDQDTQQTGETSTTETTDPLSETTTDHKDDPQTPKKKIAITFDDGPHSLHTHKILDLLERYDAKATFFVLGNMLASNTKDELARAISLGCEIGNHSYDHESLTTLSDLQVIEEIVSTNNKIKEYSGTNYECKLYRPPYGSIDRDVMETLYDNGTQMHAILWSSDSRDWEYKTKYLNGQISRDQAIEGAFRTIVNETSEGTVILMHDIHEITPDILALVLEKYTSEGYEFVTVSELFGFDETSDRDSYFYRYRSTSSIVPAS